MSEAAWRRIPPVTMTLAGAFVAAYIAFLLLNGGAQNQIFYAFSLIPARFEAGGPLRFDAWYEALGPLLGHVFLHGGWLHLGMNTLVFLQAAPYVERRVGGARFLLVVLVSAVGGAIAYILINPHSQSPAVGASGAVCGVFAAYFLAVRPTPQAALADPSVRSAITSFLLINVVLMGILSAMGVLPIAWEAHLGGFLAGGVAQLLVAPRR